MVPGALELGECRGGPGEDFTTPAPGAKWLGFKRHLIHVSRHAEPTGRAHGYYSNCTPRCIFGMPCNEQASKASGTEREENRGKSWVIVEDY